ncbi:MAG: T9SS type A sorting domain-containing protein [Bacteroidales bacterium]
MKKIILTLVFLSFLVISFAQIWAPLGATWYYKTYSPMDGLSWNAEIKSVGDTIIHGKNCKILKSNGVGVCTFTPGYNPFFISQDTAKVYYYNRSLNRFCLLYDFNKIPSDTFYIPILSSFRNDSVGFIIDSVSFLTIDTTVLKVQSVTCINTPFSQYHGMAFKIIETMGSTSFLFPFCMASCDAPGTHGLLCYNDSVINYQNPDYPPDFCTTIGIKEAKSNDRIEIYPNPASSVLMIDLTDNIEVKYSINIYSILGQKKISINGAMGNKVTVIPIDKLSNGLYLIEITTKNGQKLIKKFIKE